MLKWLALLIKVIHHHLNLGMDVDFAIIVGNSCLLRGVELIALTLYSVTKLGDII